MRWPVCPLKAGGQSTRHLSRLGRLTPPNMKDIAAQLPGDVEMPAIGGAGEVAGAFPGGQGDVHRLIRGEAAIRRVIAVGEHPVDPQIAAQQVLPIRQEGYEVRVRALLTIRIGSAALMLYKGGLPPEAPLRIHFHAKERAAGVVGGIDIAAIRAEGQVAGAASPGLKAVDQAEPTIPRYPVGGERAVIRAFAGGKEQVPMPGQEGRVRATPGARQNPERPGDAVQGQGIDAAAFCFPRIGPHKKTLFLHIHSGHALPAPSVFIAPIVAQERYSVNGLNIHTGVIYSLTAIRAGGTARFQKGKQLA